MADKLTPFDFLKSINTSSPSLLKDCKADDSEVALSADSPCKQYVPFIVNRGLSQFNDTILFANEMNMRHSLPAKMQYDFLRTTIRPRKRFTKWAKKAKDPADIKLIQEAYNYSYEKAEQVYSLFTPTALKKQRNSLDKGGTR